MKIHYMAAAQTDIGLVKQVNQDSLIVKVVDTELGKVTLAVLCDGMGGYKGGAIASSECVKYVRGEFRKSKFTTLEDAKNWMEQYGNVDTYIELFGEVDE